MSQCDVARTETSRYNDPDLKKLYEPAAMLDDRSYVTHTSQCLESKSIALHCYVYYSMCYSVVAPRRKEVSLCLAENTASALKMPIGLCLLGKIIVVGSENHTKPINTSAWAVAHVCCLPVGF